mmetsp:Transcript_22243/g.56144  ORF Transcript_22243/g.56144 Transcript_22243/m.56144 type:complete len:203 (-) Transcript_22243:36-644(-)
MIAPSSFFGQIALPGVAAGARAVLGGGFAAVIRRGNDYYFANARREGNYRLPHFVVRPAVDVAAAEKAPIETDDRAPLHLPADGDHVLLLQLVLVRRVELDRLQGACVRRAALRDVFDGQKHVVLEWKRVVTLAKLDLRATARVGDHVADTGHVRHLSDALYDENKMLNQYQTPTLDELKDRKVGGLMVWVFSFVLLRGRER